MNARLLQPGALVTTDYSGRVTTHRITDKTTGRSQSGILFQVEPEVPKAGGPQAWVDADWFTPHQPTEQGRLF